MTKHICQSQQTEGFWHEWKRFLFFISEVAEKTVTWRFSQIGWRWVKKTRKRDEL
jgi:hypothetical protein